MAQPAYVTEYLAALEVKKGTPYTSTSIKVTYPTANIIELARPVDGVGEGGVGISINATVMFFKAWGEQSFLSDGKTYIFKSDCVILVGILRAIV